MIFEFYWSWYEDYCPIVLEGLEKTQEEFELDCKKAMEESFDGYMKKEKSWASLPNWIEVASIKLEDYGYKIIKPISFGYFGLYLPKEDSREEEQQMPEFLEQINKMKKYNIEFEKCL